MIKELQRQHQQEVRESIYQQITHMSQIMGIDPPEMENIKPVVKPVSSWEEQQVMDGLSEPKNPHPLPPELWGMDMDGRNED